MGPIKGFLLFGIFISGCYLWGNAILSRLLPEVSVRRTVSTSVALGMAVLSYSMYLIGSGGWVSRAAVLTFFALFSLLGVISGRWPLPYSPPYKEKKEAEDIFLLVSVLIFSVISLFGALAPPVGTDSLCYHLGIPEKYIMQGYIGFIPYTINSLYPFFMEMMYTAMEILNSGIAAKLFHWVCGPLTALSIIFFSEEIREKRTGLVAAALFISSPGIFNAMTYAYVDVGLTLYITLSVLFLILWDIEKGPRRKIYLLLSGMFMGVSLSIKFLAIYMLIPCFTLLVWRAMRQEKQRMTTLVLFVAPCFLLSFFWYLKAYMVLGNPVFPAFSGFFGGAVSIDLDHHMKMGAGKELWDLLKLPWNMSVHPGLFGGRGSQIGIQFLLFIPWIISSMFRREKWIRDISVFSIGYIVIWFMLVQRDRFLYPVLPLLGILAGHAVSPFLRRGKNFSVRPYDRIMSFVTVTALVLSLLFNAAICLYHNRHHYPVVLGMEARDEYLNRWVTNYRMAEYVNENLPESAKILGVGIYKPYYFERWVVREGLFDLWEDYRKKFEDPASLIEFLKDKGFTHVIYKSKQGKSTPEYIRDIVENTSLLYEYGPVENIETGWIVSYRLYRL